MMIYYIITMFIESIWQTLHSDQKWDLKKAKVLLAQAPLTNFQAPSATLFLPIFHASLALAIWLPMLKILFFSISP